MPKKSAAKTPAPKSDRIKGSKINKAGSAASKKSAASIVVSEKVLKTLKDKADKYNETHTSKVSVNTLKAVFRRGSGAYSTSHRPTITGGAPNSRNAWSFARVNKFLLKKGGTKVKAAYVQDDDLMANMGEGGKTYNDKELLERYKKGESIGFTGVAHLKAKGLIPRADGTKRKSEKYMENGGQLKNSDMQLLAPNGKKSNLTPKQYKLVRTPQFKAWFGDWENEPFNSSQVVDKNGEPLVVYNGFRKESFNVFKQSKIGKGFTTTKSGFFFTTNYNTALTYTFDLDDALKQLPPKERQWAMMAYTWDGKPIPKEYIKFKKDKVRSFFLNIRNLTSVPDFPLKGRKWDNLIKAGIDLDGAVNEVNEENYNDGVVIENIDDSLQVKGGMNDFKGGFVGDDYIVFKSNQIKLADGTNTTFNNRNQDIRLEDGGEIAPNGKKSNLTPNQYKLVRTPQFKAWFGDWENDPQNASKVIDYNGEPLVVYHGTYAKEKFNIFDFSKADLGFHFGTYEQAKDRSLTKFAMKEHKQFIEPFFLNIRQLFLIEDAFMFEYPQSYIGDLVEKRILTKGEVSENSLRGLEIKQSNQIVRNILVEKYKKVGFKYYNKLEGEGYSYIVCEPNQIKLSDGKNTTFDTNNEDIRYEDGGELKDVICVNCAWSWNTKDSDESDKYVCHKCGFDNTLFYSTEIIQKFDEFADKRLKGAEKITNDSLEKGGLSLLTYYHYNAKLPTYEKASKGGFDLEKAKQEFEQYQSQLSIGMKQIDFQEIMGKMEVLGELIIEEMELLPKEMDESKNATFEEEFKEGGVVVGKRHSEEDENGTGERFLVESTGQVVEVEGGEGVLSKESMSSDKKYDLDGVKMTGRQIASKLNHKYGGVEFAEGGEVGHVCGCRSKQYKHGGELASATLQGLSGGEAVVTVKTMESKDLYTFEGRKMNPRQILSKINADSGGKKFDEGGTIDLTKNILEKQNKLTKMVYFTENILYS